MAMGSEHTETTGEMAELKGKLKATWESGDYGHFSQYLEPGAREFLASIDIAPGTQVLDVACGSGQLAIPIAEAGGDVTGVDIASNLVEQARARAAKAGLDARFDEGDAEALPYGDAGFDLVISLFGAMFAPRPERVAAELLRVCRPGGRVVMGNWTPEGFIGQMFKTVSRHAPPSPLMVPPVLWGDEDTVVERLGEGVAELSMERRLYPFRYPFPPGDVVDHFATYYGPINRALNALDSERGLALRRDLEQLWSEHNQADGDSTHCDGEYLMVIATRA